VEVSSTITCPGCGHREREIMSAAKLDTYGVPFLFYTAYEAAEISEAWPDAPIVRKPARSERLVRVLESLISPKG
jgi:hypothetical protein